MLILTWKKYPEVEDRLQDMQDTEFHLFWTFNVFNKRTSFLLAVKLHSRVSNLSEIFQVIFLNKLIKNVEYN